MVDPMRISSDTLTIKLEPFEKMKKKSNLIRSKPRKVDLNKAFCSTRSYKQKEDENPEGILKSLKRKLGLSAENWEITEMEKQLEEPRKIGAKKEPEGITPKEAELTKVYDSLISNLINIIESKKTITM